MSNIHSLKGLVSFPQLVPPEGKNFSSSVILHFPDVIQSMFLAFLHPLWVNL
jgi:hypothetical protein